MEPWQCRYAPSLGALEDTPENVWGTIPYEDTLKPTVFFGLYGLPDFIALWRHKGKKAILWAGSDIVHFINGYWLDDIGNIRLSPRPLARWINENCESYVENSIEQDMLRSIGIEAIVGQSFMGDIRGYGISYTRAKRPKVYLSVSGDNFKMYGWDIIEEIASKCSVDFYLYGSDKWVSIHKNVFVRGKIPKGQMNAEIKDMQAGVRLNVFDGFSEILAKSVLWAQHPISLIPYPSIQSFEAGRHGYLIHLLNTLTDKDEPNFEGRDHYRATLNNYPWNVKKH